MENGSNDLIKEKGTQIKNKYRGEVFSEEQAGGHPGTIIHRDNKILKKAKKSEIQFYEWLYGIDVSDSVRFFHNYLPKFFGTEIIDGNQYLILENLHHGYDNPSVMDCKLGKITWKKNADPEKIQSQRIKNEKSTCATHGFRITGLLFRDKKGEIIEKLQKPEVENEITSDNIKSYFSKMVSFEGLIQKNIVNDLIIHVEGLLQLFKNQTEKTFIASSIYFVIGKNGKHQARYIDVAHPEEAEGKNDVNVIEGIEGVLSVLKSL